MYIFSFCREEYKKNIRNTEYKKSSCDDRRRNESSPLNVSKIRVIQGLLLSRFESWTAARVTLLFLKSLGCDDDDGVW